LVFVLFVTQLVYPSRVWIALLWMVAGSTALAFVWAREMAHRVTAQRGLEYGWMQVGDRMEEQFAIQNESNLPVLWAEVLDESDLPGYQVRRVASCEPHNTTRWTTAQECAQRGVFRLGPWSLRTGDPFGFFMVTFWHPEIETIVVYPPVVDMSQVRLPRGLVAGASRSRRQTTEATIDASHTRSYRPRDSLRIIHWPSTAHRGSLIVREPDTEILGDLWIVLDLDESVQVGEGQESTEEYGVILAASLADRTLRQNRAVGLVVHGADLTFIPPGRGKAQMWHILQALAVARAGAARHLDELLHQLRQSLGHGIPLLVITPSTSVEWVDALLPFTQSGFLPTVVQIDRETFRSGDLTGSSGVRSNGLQALLAKAGISTYVVEQGYPFHHLVPLQRRGHWVFKTSPLGRAVVVRRPGEE
jgi:uncharacterized protein (DUF58 family)